MNMSLDVASVACQKLVQDMFYEARISQYIYYKGTYEKVKVKKNQCRNLRLTKEQYLMVSTTLCCSSILHNLIVFFVCALDHV